MAKGSLLKILGQRAIRTLFPTFNKAQVHRKKLLVIEPAHHHHPHEKQSSYLVFQDQFFSRGRKLGKYLLGICEEKIA